MRPGTVLSVQYCTFEGYYLILYIYTVIRLITWGQNSNQKPISLMILPILKSTTISLYSLYCSYIIFRADIFFIRDLVYENSSHNFDHRIAHMQFLQWPEVALLVLRWTRDRIVTPEMDQRPHCYSWDGPEAALLLLRWTRGRIVSPEIYQWAHC